MTPSRTSARTTYALRWLGAALAPILFSLGATGQPAARPAGLGDDGWSSAFPAGTFANSYEGVSAVAMMGSDVYVGGSFNAVGGVATGPVARWDGTAWSAVGLNGPAGSYHSVSALAVVGSNLYATWNYHAGGVATSSVMMWDGSTWSAVVSPAFSALVASPGGELYACSSYPASQLGAVERGMVFKLNAATNSWTMIGDFPTEVYALAVAANGDLYAAGNPGVLGSVARWNGTAWAALDTATHMGTVDALATDGTNVYASYTIFGSTPDLNQHPVMKWNGATWSALGSGLSGGSQSNFGFPGVSVHGSIWALAVSGSTVYVGGDFALAGGLPSPHIARWDGTAWSSLGTGLNETVQTLAVSPAGTVYAGGSFTAVGDSSKPIDRFGAYTFRPTGLPTLADPASLTLSPNPAPAGLFVMRLTAAPPHALVGLLDATARTLRTLRTDDTGTALLDVRGLAPGLYLVRAGAATRRLVVE